MSHSYKPAAEKAVVETVEAPWSTALVLVCSECDGGRGVDLAQALKDEIKQKIESAGGHKKEIRVARVRCLGICPKRGVAVTIASETRTAESYVVAPRDKAAVPALCATILRDT